MSKAGRKGRAAVQLVFLVPTVIAAVIWCDALGRGTNDFFVPLLILLYVGIVAITALPKVLSGDTPGGAKWTYGALCLAVIVMGGLQIVHNIRCDFSFFPSAAALERLKSDFGLVSIYNVITDSWIFAALHVIAAVAGVLSVYMALKEQRDN
jgi:hypothetical protein